jgi:hypothetical protein
MKNLKLSAVAVALIFAFGALFMSFEDITSAANTTTVVVEADIARQAENTAPTKNWVLFSRNAGNAAFRMGPGTAPSGIGSIEFSTPTGDDKITLFNFDHVGTALSTIDTIGYSTYRTAGNLQQVAALNLQVDVNGDASGGFTTLVFEPVYNAGQGLVINNQWQTWDAFNNGEATWWSSNPIPSAPNRDTFVSWATIVAANPDAVIVGGVGINQGSGNPGLVTAVDAFLFGYGDDLYKYDFEPYNKNSCKNGGWTVLQRADGTSFTNQGQCVAYTNTNR